MGKEIGENMQDTIFEKQEADQWFLRNRDTLINRKAENDLIVQEISKLPNLNEIKSVIELGSSNGYRLNFFKEILSSCKKIVGMDASEQAVQDGIKRYGLEMHKNTLCNFKTQEKFDLVIVNFVLHWIDRENIFQCIANIDKCTNSGGGMLVIGDFSPYYPYKKIYHHYTKERIYTYKLNYENVFLSLNTYKTMKKITFNHDDKNKEADNLNNASIVILKKNSNEYYPVE